MRRSLITAALALGTALACGAPAWGSPPRQLCEVHLRSNYMTKPLGPALLDSVGIQLDGTIACNGEPPSPSQMSLRLEPTACAAAHGQGSLGVKLGSYSGTPVFEMVWAGALAWLHIGWPDGDGVLQVTPTANPAAQQCLTGMSIDGFFVWHVWQGTPLDEDLWARG
jgi:hypothetical protein